MLPRVNIIRTPIADYLLLSTRDALSVELYASGDYARALRGIALAWCEGIDNPVVMDIGANLGAFSIPFAKQIESKNGRVFCYEPQRIVYYQLCGNIFLNRIDNCVASQRAFGASDEMIEISEVDFDKSVNVGGYSLNAHLNQGLNHVITKATRHPVQLSKLDSIDLPAAPTLIKIDVEGSELDVLKGGGKFLKANNYPFLILECWQADWYAPRRKEVLSLLEEFGYQSFIFEEDILAQHIANTRFTFEDLGNGKINMSKIG